MFLCGGKTARNEQGIIFGFHTLLVAGGLRALNVAANCADDEIEQGFAAGFGEQRFGD